MNFLEKAAKNAPPPEGATENPEVENEDSQPDETDPGFLQAKELLLSKLYEEGAAQGLAKAIQAAPNPVQGVIDQTMRLLEVIETATQGSVPDELVMRFVVDATQEVVDLATESGVQLSNEDIAVVVREVLANVVDTMGGDSSAIRQEMGQIDPKEVGSAMEEMHDGA